MSLSSEDLQFLGSIVSARIARTLAVLREMAEGKTITMAGHEFGMTSDMMIGPIVDFGRGSAVSSVSDMSLSSFHALLEKEGIGMPIPDRHRRSVVWEDGGE